MNIDMTLLALAVLTAAPTAQGSLPDAFPFGISEQRTPSALGCNSVTGGPPDSTGQYVCHTLPRANGLFNEYILAYLKGMGICNGVAVSPYIRDDRRGIEIRRLFQQASEAVAAEFGAPDETVDDLSTASAQRDIISEDRQIFHQWNDLGRRFKNMQSTCLAISGSEDLGLAVYGVYRFAGNDRCLRQMELVTGLFSDE